jgi:hypothetical protein
MNRTTLAASTPREPNPLASSRLKVCPECAAPLVPAAGCFSCRHCGWGQCG